MKNKKSLIFAGIEAALAIMLILIVKVIAPVCNGMVETAAGKQVPMRCHYASVVFVFLGIVLLVNAVLCAVRKEMVVCGTMTIAISVFMFVALSSKIGTGICMNPEMPCNFTASFVIVLGGIGIVVGGLSVYSALKDTK